MLDRPNGEGSSVVHVDADEEGARLDCMPVSLKETNRLVRPFIGDSKEDIVRLFAEYRAGQFVRMSELARQDG